MVIDVPLNKWGILVMYIKLAAPQGTTLISNQ
jgi:hypothetical protein